LFKILRITGMSLSPAYLHGDYVLIQKIGQLNRLRIGDVIVFQLRGYGRLIKQVSSLDLDKDACLVEGTAPDSISSDSFGAVPLTAILGKVILHIPKK